MMQDYAKTNSKPSNKANKDRKLLLPAGFVVTACALLALALSGGPETSVEELTDIAPPAKNVVEAGEIDRNSTQAFHERTTNTATLRPVEPPPMLVPLPDSVVSDVKQGDTLAKIFASHNLGSQILHTLLLNTKDGKILNSIKPGQTLTFEFQPDRSLKRLTFQTDFRNAYVFESRPQTNEFESYKKTIEYDVRTLAAHAVIEDSFFIAGLDAGLSNNIIMELASMFGWDIDFAMDIREGDSFSVVYEELFSKHEKIKDGDILAAQFMNQGKKYTAIRFEDNAGNVSYYSQEGKNLRKTFLRSPVAFTRISSRFSLGRKHPILHRIRAHKGVDYAASRGTPIKAVGDGKVIFAGRKGGYGNVVILQHGKYSTLYAHMHRFGNGIRVGKSVKQGQVIGSVGSTGLATGPHLHYEFLVNGVHKNPLTVEFPSAEPLSKPELERFKQHSQKLLAKLEMLNGETQIAAGDKSNNDG